MSFSKKYQQLPIVLMLMLYTFSVFASSYIHQLAFHNNDSAECVDVHNSAGYKVSKNITSCDTQCQTCSFSTFGLEAPHPELFSVLVYRYYFQNFFIQDLVVQTSTIFHFYKRGPPLV